MSSRRHAALRSTCEVVAEGLRSLLRRPLRSLLTATTSAIAIAVTVNVISLSFGLEADIRGDVGLFGRRTVDVSRLPVLVPGRARPPLGAAEEARVRQVLEGLDATIVPRRQVAGVVHLPAAGGLAQPSQRLQVVAAPPAYLETLQVPVAAGRWLRPGDADGRDGEGVCTLDASTAQHLFPGTRPTEALGRVMEIAIFGRRRHFRVVGILSDPLRHRALFDTFDEGRGARTLTSSLLSFRNIYVPSSTLADEEYSGISIVLPTDAAVGVARDRLLGIWSLDASDPRAFARGGIGVFVRREWMDAFGATTRKGTLVGNVVWIIVVLVAIVMISTLNLITIRERYEEVAIRRCEGARRRDIALQITAEGVVTSLVGGLAGLPVGYVGAALLRAIVRFPFRFEFQYALAATGIAILLGLLSSVVPARHAARLQPARVLGRRLT